MNRSAPVMLFLISNIRLYPFKIFRSKRHHSVPALPLKRITQLVRTRPFLLPDPLIDLKWRVKTSGKMNVVSYAANRMKINIFLAYDPILDKGM